MKNQKQYSILFLFIGVMVSLFSCGGGSTVGGNSDDTQTFSISGFVTSAVSGLAIPSVAVTMSGDTSSVTITDGTGNYSFDNLANGTYTITASLMDAVFNPESILVNINGANDQDEDFQSVRGSVIDSNIEFLPQLFQSDNQLRVSLHIDSDNIVFTDSSDTPLKKQTLDGSPPTVLANRFDSVESVVLFNGSIFWIEGGNLHRMTPEGTSTIIANGKREVGEDVTSDIVVDDSHVYWVDQAENQACSPPCNWVIQKIPLDGGAPINLVNADIRVDSLKGDAENIYWEEGFSSSKIKLVPKAGGTTTVLVDETLNGTLPLPPPGFTPGEWHPTGGIALTSSEIIFAVTRNLAYDIKSIPISGGAIRDLASVTTSASYARNSVLDITVNGSDIFWIDNGNGTLNTIPITGGTVVTLISGLTSPGALATNSTTAFWTESGASIGCCKVMGEGTVRQIPLTGGTAITVADNLDIPQTIAVDADNLVWSEQWRLAKKSNTGGLISTLVSGVSSDMARITIAQSNVYILDGDLVKVVPLSGGTVEKLAPAKFGSIVNLSLRNVDIVSDNTSIYWAIRGVLGSPVVQKIAITGGVPETLVNEAIIPNSQDCYWRLALDEQSVYWSEGSMTHPVGCTVKKVPLNGGAITTLVDQAYLADFTVDGVNLYFSEFEGIPSIQKVSTSGGAPSIIAEDVAALVLANDSNNLYWHEFGTGSDSIGTISKTGSDDRAETWLIPVDIDINPFTALEGLLVSDEGIYFSETQTGSIFRLY